MDTTLHTHPRTSEAPKALNLIIAAIPFVVVGVGVYGIGYGLLRLLRGDESLVPILWAAVVPVLSVPVGLGLQMLLVNLVSRRYATTAYDASDESSFL